MQKTIDQQRYVKYSGWIIIDAVAMILLPIIFCSPTLACIKVLEVSIYAGKTQAEADEHEYDGETMYIPIDSQAYFRAEIDDVCNPDNKDFVWHFDLDSDGIWDYNTLTYWLSCTPPPWTYETKGWYHPKVKVELEGVPDSDADDTCQVAVVTVNNVVWQTYGDNTPLAGGKIFPGKKTYEDEHGPDRRKVKVKATLNIAPDASDNIYLHFKRWDVDDPCFSTAPLDPDDSDPDPNKHSIDNRGSFKFENNDHSIDVLAEGCIVYTTFLVSMNPGDNYRITATTSQEANDDLTHYKVETGNIPSSVKRTPMLTTWRKLWIERDYMAPVPSTGNEKNRITGTADSYNYDTGTDQTTVDLGQNMPAYFDDITTGASPTHQFVNGRYIVGGNTYNVISYSDPIGDDEVVVGGNCSNEPKDYILYDDDDQTMLDSPYYCSFDAYFDAFREAYIEPIYLPTSESNEVDFNLNLTIFEADYGIGNWDDKQNVVSASYFWACLIVTCYQPGSSEDFDGEWDTTHGGVDGDTTQNINVAIIFVEEFRDYNDTTGSSKTEALIVAHEVGHTGGGSHGDGNYWDIMGDEDGDFDANANSFADETLNTFRTHITWLETN